jgi:hypothetical protein
MLFPISKFPNNIFLVEIFSNLVKFSTLILLDL